MPYLKDLADIPRKAGLKVTEVAGWQTRGHGVMGSVQTITCHHTANGGARGDAPSLTVVTHGRPGLSGPLSHYVLGRSGRVYVVAAGLCYHAGASRWDRQTNGHAIGIEAEAEGVPGAGGDWPEVQMEAYARLCRALMVSYDVPIGQVEGHKETCRPAGRKSDPSFSMAEFRRRIVSTSLLTPSKGPDEMSFRDTHKITEQDVKDWGDEAPGKVGDEVSYDFIVRNPPTVARLRRETAAEFAKLRKLITENR